MTPRSPVPQEVSAELARVVRRWQQLPLDHALSSAPRVRLLLEALGGQGVPDLGPAVLMDQLTVLVHDSCVRGIPSGAVPLEEQLAALRRDLP